MKKNKRYRYVQEIHQHGRTHLYFRYRGRPLVSLPTPLGSEQFMQAYNAAYSKALKDPSKLSPVKRNQASERRRAWRRKNRLKDNEKNRYYRHNITSEQYKNMFAAQNNACACCGSTDPHGLNGWHIDHDHKTNWVRAILCRPCNSTIGLAKENAQRLRACAEYLDTANECRDVS